MNNKKDKSEKTTKIPFSQRHPRLNLLLGLLLWCCIIVLGLFVLNYIIMLLGNCGSSFLSWIGEQFSEMEAVVVVALITGAVSLTGVVLSSVVSKVIEYKQKRRDYLNQKREKPYGQFVDMYFKIFENTKKNNYSEEDMLSDMLAFSRELTLWGSNRVVKKWIAFRLNSSEDDKKSLYLIEKLLFEMRKDLGFKKMKKGNLLKMIVNDYDESIKNHKNK